MRILRADPTAPGPDVLADAVALLAAGGVLAYPTDTLYGLAVDPRLDDAVLRLYRTKAREARFAVPLVAGSMAQALEAGHFDDADLALARAFWPGPLSLVVRPAACLSRHLLGAGQKVAIRVPAHAVARTLALQFGFPITATSANVSGAPPSASGDEAAAALAGRIDAVLDAGPSPGGPPSTIVETTSTGPRLIRAGAIAFERVLKSGQ
jgi:L-threonylcarbamoyladenylate synthase